MHKFSVTMQKGKLKTEVTRKQSMQNFPKNEHFLTRDTHTYENTTILVI